MNLLDKLTGYSTQVASIGQNVANVIRQPDQVRAQEQTAIAAANPPPPNNNKTLLAIGISLGLLALGALALMWKRG